MTGPQKESFFMNDCNGDLKNKQNKLFLRKEARLGTTVMCHTLLRISGYFVLQILHALTTGIMWVGHSDSLFIQPRGKVNTRSIWKHKRP